MISHLRTIIWLFSLLLIINLCQGDPYYYDYGTASTRADSGYVTIAPDCRCCPDEYIRVENKCYKVNAAKKFNARKMQVDWNLCREFVSIMTAVSGQLAYTHIYIYIYINC